MNTSRKAYIAAPIFTPEQLAVVECIKYVLTYAGYEVFSPYHASRQVWRGRAPKDCTEEERKRVLDGNVVNLNGPTSLLVAWVGGSRTNKSTDNGVAWEMGYFHNRVLRGDYQSDSPVPMTVAYIDPIDARQDMNLMLAGTVDAAARGVVQLQRAVSLHAGGRYDELRDEHHPSHLIRHEAGRCG